MFGLQIVSSVISQTAQRVISGGKAAAGSSRQWDFNPG